MAEEKLTEQSKNIQYAELFDNVLDKNEQILRVIKPNKLKLFVYWFLSAFWINVWIAIVGILPFCFEEAIPWEYFLIPVGVIVLVFICTGIFAAIYYKNNYFAYTNSRILIRSGIIGIDFKSLDMRYVGALNVKVGFVDKVLKNRIISCTPNPTNGYVNISTKLEAETKDAYIIITNLSGTKEKELIVSPSLPTVTEDISSLDDGIYVASLYVNNTLCNSIRIIKE